MSVKINHNRITFFKIIFPILFLLLNINLAYAGEADVDAVERPSVTLTLSRIPAPVETRSGAIAVITRDEIAARRDASVIDLLRHVPGLHIDQPGGRGGVSSVFIRGGDPNYTLVLIDGVKVNDPTNSRGGSFDFSSIDIDSVERIEIRRGPLSSVYGSEALAGVINIITRSGSGKPALFVSTAGGDNGYAKGGILARGFFGSNTKYSFIAGYVDDGTAVEGNKFIGKTFGTSINVTPSESASIGWTMRYAQNEAKTFPDDSGGPRFALLREVDARDSTELGSGLNYSKSFSWGKQSFMASYYNREEETVSPGVAPGSRDPFGIPPNSFDNSYTRTSIVTSSLIDLPGDTKLNIGADGEIETGRSDGVLILGPTEMLNKFELEREIYGAFIELQHTMLHRLTIKASLRADFPSDADTQTSPNIGLLYKLVSTGTTLKANWGKGFKLPSFFALGNPIVGNPDLKPETSESWDFGVTQSLMDEKASVTITIFKSAFYNVVDMSEGPPPRLVNQAEVSSEGAELALSIHPAGNVWVDAHATYLETDIKDTDEELRGRPKWRGGISSRFRPYGRLMAHVDFLYVGETFDSSIPTGDRYLDAYRRVDIGATLGVSKMGEVYLAVDNLLDEKYEEAVGFQAAGTRWRVGGKLLF